MNCYGKSSLIKKKTDLMLRVRFNIEDGIVDKQNKLVPYRSNNTESTDADKSGNTTSVTLT